MKNQENKIHNDNNANGKHTSTQHAECHVNNYKLNKARLSSGDLIKRPPSFLLRWEFMGGKPCTYTLVLADFAELPLHFSILCFQFDGSLQK